MLKFNGEKLAKKANNKRASDIFVIFPIYLFHKKTTNPRTIRTTTAIAIIPKENWEDN